MWFLYIDFFIQQTYTLLINENYLSVAHQYIEFANNIF